MWVGRLSTGALVVLGLLWIPLMGLISGQLYQYLQSVQAYIAPPIAAVFLLGLLSTRLNGHGAIAALLTGFVLGMGRLVAELNKPNANGSLGVGRQRAERPLALLQRSSYPVHVEAKGGLAP